MFSLRALSSALVIASALLATSTAQARTIAPGERGSVTTNSGPNARTMLCESADDHRAALHGDQDAADDCFYLLPDLRAEVLDGDEKGLLHVRLLNGDFKGRSLYVAKRYFRADKPSDGASAKRAPKQAKGNH